MIVEQLLYTATEEDRENGISRGYSVVAKSSGITDDILKFLEFYHYPLDCHNHDRFERNKYRSLLKFKKWLIYTVAHTATGYDGRRATYSTRHFVFLKSEFVEIDNDTRKIDPYIIQLSHDTRHLPTLTIWENHLSMTYHPPLLCNGDMIIIPMFVKIVQALEKKRKVAIILKENQTIEIQEIIGRLEINERVIPWSNAVYDPERQTNFKFVVGAHGLKIRLKQGWKIFDLTRSTTT